MACLCVVFCSLSSSMSSFLFFPLCFPLSHFSLLLPSVSFFFFACPCLSHRRQRQDKVSLLFLCLHGEPPFLCNLDFLSLALFPSVSLCPTLFHFGLSHFSTLLILRARAVSSFFLLTNALASSLFFSL